MSFRPPLSPAMATALSYAAMGLKELHNTFLMTRNRPFVAPYMNDMVWVAQVEGKLAHGFGLRNLPVGQEFLRLDASLQHGRINNVPLFKLESPSDYSH